VTAAPEPGRDTHTVYIWLYIIFDLPIRRFTISMPCTDRRTARQTDRQTERQTDCFLLLGHGLLGPPVGGASGGVTGAGQVAGGAAVVGGAAQRQRGGQAVTITARGHPGGHRARTHTHTHKTSDESME